MNYKVVITKSKALLLPTGNYSFAHFTTHHLTRLNPCSTFVNSESDKLKLLASKLNEYKKTVHHIKGRIS